MKRHYLEVRKMEDLQKYVDAVRATVGDVAVYWVTVQRIVLADDDNPASLEKALRPLYEDDPHVKSLEVHAVREDTFPRKSKEAGP